MIKSLHELKELIIWAKENKVKSLHISDVKFELSEIAFVDQFNSLSDPTKSESSLNNSSTLGDLENLTPEEEQELLYFSAR